MIGVYLEIGAFANMPSLRKVKFDCMKPSDSLWGIYGRKSGANNWLFDSVYVTNTYTYSKFNGQLLLFYNSPKLEEVDFCYDEGGVFQLQKTGTAVTKRMTNCFWGTKLKELKMRLYVQEKAAATGAMT